MTEETVQMLIECGACQDCGCPVRDESTARSHASGDGCYDWNEGEGRNRITFLHADGSYTLGVINPTDEIEELS